MKLFLNEKEVRSVNLLIDVIENTENDFDIEIKHNEKNWIQFFRENTYVSVAKFQDGKIYYCNELQSRNIKELIDIYIRNPAYLQLRWNTQSEKTNKNKQSLKTTCSSVRNIFLIFLLLTVIQIILLLIREGYQGSIIMKLYKFYFNPAIHPKQKSLPIFTVTTFLLYIIYIIKLKVQKAKANRVNTCSKD